MTLLSNSDEADDATQDVLMKLWEQRDSLDSITSPKAYAIRIARNKCIDLLRAPAYRLRDPEEPTDLQMSATTASPQEILVAREQADRLNAWVQTLPEQQHEVFRLRHDEMLTNGEVAERLGLQEVTVRSMVSRLRKEARRLFEEN